MESPREISLSDALSLAQRLHKDCEFSDAEQVYRAILAVAPEHPDTLHYLGVLLHLQGKSVEGTELIRKALALAPEYADAWSNLGNLLKETGQAEGAVAAYRQALALRPEFADAWHNLGVALKSLGHIDEAIAAYRRAVAIKPRLGESYRDMGYILSQAGRLDEATSIFRQWLLMAPDNPVAHHLLAACAGDEVPGRAEDGYVRTVFDRFADTFDEKLAGLEYQAPERVAAALAKLYPEPRADLDTLDAGCGTGLCEPYLASYSRCLTGVDLSAGMLDKARRRGGYHALIEAELTAYLEGHPGCFDLIVSADTLVYFGDLAAVSRAAHAALRPHGHLVFTVEQADVGTYRLNPHGRYSHCEAYVRQVLEDAGLSIIAIELTTLRKENEVPVAGLLVSASRTSQTCDN